MDEPTPEHQHLFPGTRGWARAPSGWFLPGTWFSRARSLAARFPVSSLLLREGKEERSRHPPSNTPLPGSGEPEAPRAKPGCAGLR